MGKYGEKAVKLHDEKYNCTQSVVLAFSDEIGIDKDVLAKLVSNLGGGFGYSGEVCGAASGMAIVSGFFGEWNDIKDVKSKMESYNTIKALIEQFRENANDSRCDELRKLRKDGGKTCAQLIEMCADMVAKEMGFEE